MKIISMTLIKFMAGVHLRTTEMFHQCEIMAFVAADNDVDADNDDDEDDSFGKLVLH